MSGKISLEHAGGARLRGLRVIVVYAAAVMSTGCVSRSYMGIPLAPGQAGSEVQVLAQRARGGEKQAQLDLGIAFEEGRGVPRNMERAMQLYAIAASDGGRMTWIYLPPVANAAMGHAVQIELGRYVAGLPEARNRLLRLQRGAQ